jgi:uncharacterized Tic20 family protein
MGLKKLGVISVVIAILSIIPSLVTGIGIVLALFALLLSGVSAISGKLKYVTAVILLTTMNLFFLSIASTSWMNKQYAYPYIDDKEIPSDWPELEGAKERKKEALYEFIRWVSLPYAVTLGCAAIGVWRSRKRNE